MPVNTEAQRQRRRDTWHSVIAATVILILTGGFLLALAWCLRDEQVATVLAGASCAAQIRENAAAAQNTSFTEEERAAIEAVLK